MTLADECHRACESAVSAYTGEPVVVELPEGLSVQELHGIVTFWRLAGWSADVDSTGRILTLG